MSETRKLAAILVSDVAGYSRLAAADEDRTLARLRTSGILFQPLFHRAPPRRVLNKILEPRNAVTTSVSSVLIPIDLKANSPAFP
jgi:hypothetical protein